MFCKENNSIGLAIGKIASEMGKGLMAGAAGTLAITLSQMVEMKITKRKPSTAPAKAAQKVLHIKPQTVAYKNKFSQEVHWAYGTSWGLPRGILGLFGLKGLTATSIHFATIYASALIVPTSLEVAPPLKQWSAKEFAIDALHHAVYAIAAGLVYDALNED